MYINRFDGGVADDVRHALPHQFALSHHFDLSKPHKLIPYRDMEDEAGSLGDYEIKSVELFTDSGGTQNLFALGKKSDNTFPQILEKSVNIVTGTFAESTTGVGAAGVVLPTTLRGYKNQNKLYFMKTLSGNTVVDSYDPASNTYASAVGTITGVSVTGIYPRPFRHPLDDILYFGAGNVIASLDGATFTAAAFTLPEGLDITGFTDYGAFLAIACAPIDEGGKSFVFLWGRDTSLVYADEVLDFGEGSLMVLENVEGALLGISSATTGTGTDLDIDPRIVFRAYAGGFPRVFKELRWEGTGVPTIRLRNLKAKHNDRLYFSLSTYLQNKTVNQIWVTGFNTVGELYVAPDRLVNNDTALTGDIDGLDIIGDYLWVGYNGDGSLKRTNDAATFTATCIHESACFNEGDSDETKTLLGISVTFEPLPSAGQVVAKYRVNEETTWTTLFTHTTDDSISYGSVAKRDFKELFIRVESTGGAVITGYDYKAIPKRQKKYAN